MALIIIIIVSNYPQKYFGLSNPISVQFFYQSKCLTWALYRFTLKISLQILRYDTIQDFLLSFIIHISISRF